MRCFSKFAKFKLSLDSFFRVPKSMSTKPLGISGEGIETTPNPPVEGFLKRPQMAAGEIFKFLNEPHQHEITRDPVLLQTTVIEYHGEVLFMNTNNGAPIDQNSVLNVPPVPAQAAAANAAILSGASNPLGLGAHGPGIAAGSTIFGSNAAQHASYASLYGGAASPLMSGGRSNTTVVSISNPNNTSTATSLGGANDTTNTHVFHNTSGGSAGVGNVLTATPAPASILNHALFHGQGRLVSTLGYTYTGEFDRGLMHGKGRIVWADGTSFEGTFNNGVIDGSGKYVWPNGDHYEGEVKNSVRHGKGKFFLKVSGEVYDGDWFGGMRHGQGTLYYSPQSSHQSTSSPVAMPVLNPMALSASALGTTASGPSSQQGSGALKPAVVCKYVGTWDRDKKCGQGTLTYSNGDTYEGEWSNDLRNGKGVMTWRNGPNGNVVEIYNGEWVDGIQEGYGESTYIRPTAAGALAFAQSIALAQSTDGLTPTNGPASSVSNVPKAPQTRRMSQAGAGVLPAGNRPSATTITGRKSTVTSPSSVPFANNSGSDEGALASMLTDPCGNLGTGIVLSSVAAASAARDRALNSYAGEFVQGQREGFGVFVYDDGSTYEGMWLNNVKHGEGKLVSANGVTFVGVFENGVPVNREDSQHIKNLRAGLNASPPTSPRNTFGSQPSAGNTTSGVTSNTTSAPNAASTGATSKPVPRSSATALGTSVPVAAGNASSAGAATISPNPNAATGNGDAATGSNAKAVSTTPTSLLTVVANPLPLYIKDIIGVGENCVPEAIAAVQTVSSRYHSTLKKLFFYYSHLERGGVEVVTVPNGTNPEIVAPTMDTAGSAATDGAIVEFSAVGSGTNAFRRASIGAGGSDQSAQPQQQQRGSLLSLPALPQPPPPPPISWKRGRLHGTMHILQLLRLLNDSRILNQGVTIAVVDRIIANLRDVYATTDPTSFGSIGINAPPQPPLPPTSPTSAAAASTFDATATGGTQKDSAKDPKKATTVSTGSKPRAKRSASSGGSTAPPPATASEGNLNSTPQKVPSAKATPTVTPLRASAVSQRNNNAAASPNSSNAPTGTFPTPGAAPEKGSSSSAAQGAQFNSAASIRGGGDDDFVRAHSPAPTLLGAATTLGGATNAASNNAIFRQAWVQYRAHLHTLAVGELNYREFVEVLVRLSVKVFPADVYGSVARRFALLIEEYLSVFPVGGSHYATTVVQQPTALTAATVSGIAGVSLSSDGFVNATNNTTGTPTATPTMENLSISHQSQSMAQHTQPTFRPQPLLPTTSAESMRILLWSKLPPSAISTVAKTYAVAPPVDNTSSSTSNTKKNLQMTSGFDGSASMGLVNAAGGANASTEGDIPLLKSGTASGSNKVSTSSTATAARRTSLSTAGLKQMSANNRNNDAQSNNPKDAPLSPSVSGIVSGTASSIVTTLPAPSTSVAELAAKRYKNYTYLQVLQELFLYYSGRGTFESSSEGIYGAGTLGGGAGPFLVTTTRKEQHLMQDRAALSLGYTNVENPMSNGIVGGSSGTSSAYSLNGKLTASKLQAAATNGAANPNTSGFTSSAVTPRVGMLTARPSMVAFNIADLVGGGAGLGSESVNPKVAATSPLFPSFRSAQNTHSYANRQLPPGHPLTLSPPPYAGRTITMRQFLLFVRDLGSQVLDKSLSEEQTNTTTTPSTTSVRQNSISAISVNNTSPSASAIRNSVESIAADSNGTEQDPTTANQNVFVGKTPKSSGVVVKKKKLNVIAAAQQQEFAAAALLSPIAGSINSTSTVPKVGGSVITLTPKQAMSDFTSLIAYLCGGQYARYDRYPSTTAAVLQKQQFAIAEQQRLETPAAKNNLSVNQFVKKKAAESGGDPSNSVFQQSPEDRMGEQENSPTKSTITNPNSTAAGGPASALILTTVSEASAHANAAAMFNAYQHLLKQSKGKHGVVNEVDTLLMERELVFAEFVDLVVSMAIACVTARTPTSARAGPPMLATTKVENFFEKVLVPHHNKVW